MPNDLRIRVASLVSTLATGLTDAQMQNGIQEFCEARGVPLDGTNQEVLDRFTLAVFDEVRRVARANRRRKKLATASTSIDSELDSELGT